MKENKIIGCVCMLNDEAMVSRITEWLSRALGCYLDQVKVKKY